MNKEIQELNKKAESYASELKSVSAEIATVVVGQKKLLIDYSSDCYVGVTF